VMMLWRHAWRRMSSTVGLIQMNATNNKDRNYETCVHLINQLIASTPSKIELICLPECFSFIGEASTESLNVAERIDESDVLQRYQDLAKELSVWLSLGGFQELQEGPNGERKMSNLHAIVNPKGQILSENCYRKVSNFLACLCFSNAQDPSFRLSIRQSL
jgi:deaminated glutathione amidase